MSITYVYELETILTYGLLLIRNENVVAEESVRCTEDCTTKSEGERWYS